VAHSVEIFSSENPVWFKRGNLVGAKGLAEKILVMDLGKEIRRICEEEFNTKKIINKNAVLDLGDGTQIRGVLERVSPYKGKSTERKLPNAYLNILYNSSSFKTSGEFSYSFDINTDMLKPSEPKEYHIKTYVLIDGKTVKEDKEVSKALFKVGGDGKTSVKFNHLVFSQR